MANGLRNSAGEMKKGKMVKLPGGEGRENTSLPICNFRPVKVKWKRFVWGILYLETTAVRQTERKKHPFERERLGRRGLRR